mmetsp:Transcript_13956/g.19739  ORF Transcript_13956/g.19739 Transcript_13956/m.19739 type:complete len:133 (-) Transcript_13956:63-461(-)
MLVPIRMMVAVDATETLTNALNMMPVGRLDGEGRRGWFSIEKVRRSWPRYIALETDQKQFFCDVCSIIMQAICSFYNSYTLQLFWWALVIILQKNQKILSFDEISGVGSTRRAILYVMLVLTALTLSPFYLL